MSNIKQIIVKSKDGKPGKMKLAVSGDAKVCVADIKTDDNLELINTDLVLCNSC